ncbi:serine hydrolase domain-containing protein [Kitasatospora terrestris]|uniref:Serine hydrolase domain-containing protein n=1 Tax=Kitasatospora terrestris TaxID=258051 RepID=A0ABP9DE38_9ACTN
MHNGTTGTRTGKRHARQWRAVLLAASLACAVAVPAAAAPAPVAAPAAAAKAADRPAYAGRLTQDMIALMQRLRIPGALVSITTPDSGAWTTELGTGDLTTGKPIDRGDHLRVGSITKTFTGTVVLQLVQEGLLKLDDPVSAHHPGVPDGDRITIRQLLNMTSGLYNYSEDYGFNLSLDEHPEREWTPQELLDLAFSHPSYFPPGTGFHYSNTNTVLLGLIAEHLTHQPLGKLFEQRIFNRVGMHGTSLANGDSIPSPHARGHQFITNVESLTAPTLTGKEAAWADWSAGNPYDVTHVNASWAWAAGAAESTVDDLRRWAPALATGTLLSPELQKERLTFVPTSDAPDAPGYGLAVAEFFGFIGHDGQIPGYTSFMGYDPKRCATVVVLANLNQSPDGTAPANELAKLIIGELFPS